MMIYPAEADVNNRRSRLAEMPPCNERKKRLDQQQDALKTFLNGQTAASEEVLAEQSPDDLSGACRVLRNGFQRSFMLCLR